MFFKIVIMLLIPGSSYQQDAAQADILDLLSEQSHENSAPTPELARLNGYRCDIHTVTTEDGYVIRAHRFPGGRVTPKNCSLPPVLMMHGVLDNSVTWLLAGPTQGLAYLLADRGYDVWLGNMRGNVYGRYNVRYNVDENLFWDFSWEKAGLYDLPAIIDHILNTTGHEQILYVGHSLGCTEFFVLCSLRPEYNSKVQYFVALAPVANLTYSRGILPFLVPFGDELAMFVTITSHGEFLPRNSVLLNFAQYICAIEINEGFCETLLFLLFGFDPIGFNQNLIPIIYGHTPSGSSIHTILHYFQVYLARRFQRYDYGPVKNLELYNSVIPPLFNLSEITVPTSVFYSENDALADPKDVMSLVSQLTSTTVDVYRVNLTSFNHVDFMLAKNVKTLVYDKLISIFEEKQTLSDSSSCNP